MYNVKLPLLIILFSVGFIKSNAQSSPPSNTLGLENTLKKLSTYTTDHPVEKIYVQLNKPWYNRADTLWFKLYTVSGFMHKLTTLSETAYIELIGPDNTIVEKLNLKLQAGMASGDFTLPSSLGAGNYRIRAYTNWMKNEGEETFYNRVLNIGGLSADVTRGASASARQPDIQFFPEGGELITTIRNKVAFKATNPDGTASSIKGNIIASSGDTVSAIESGHAGMGVFAITPQEGKTYSAVIQFGNTSIQTIQLPIAISKGYTIAINNINKDTLQVKIATNNAQLKEKPGADFYLLAQANGSVNYTTKGKFNDLDYRVKVPKNRFPTGIARFTLFVDGEPVSERVAFIQQPDNLEVQLSSAKTIYNANEKVNIAITANTFKSQPVVGSFAVAVTNETLVPTDEAAEPTIFSSLLLSDELHGNIIDPGYYLSARDDNGANDLDMLMLTQGYRKLEWKKLLDTTAKVPQYLAETGLNITGRVTTMSDKQAVAGGKVTLFIPSTQFTVDTLTDNRGHFAITGVDVIGKTSILLKALNSKRSNEVKIVLDKPERSSPTSVIQTYPILPNVSAAMRGIYLEQEKNLKDTKQLKEVSVTARKNAAPPELTTSANLNGPGNADEIVMGKSLADMGCVTIVECLASKLPFVTVRNGQVYDMSRGHSSIKGVGPMTVMIDGHVGNLADITANDIYSIEALTSVKYKSIYGHDAAGGLLIVTTKRGIPSNEVVTETSSSPGSLKFPFNGYYKTRTFYTPKYNPSNNLATQPSAVYWNPDILTDKEGRSSIQFSNVGKGSYRVVVEGIDGYGRLGREVYRYKVE